MFVNYNGVVRPMGYGYPLPLYFFMSSDRKITPEQLKANLKRVVERYVTVAVDNNSKKTGSDHKNPATLRTEVQGAVQTAINELLTEIMDAKIKVSPTTATTSVGVGTKVKTDSKVFNLGSYVNDMNAELNQMINDGIPV